MNNIPSIQDIYLSIIQDFENRLGVNLQGWGRFFIKAWAMVMAGWFYMLFTKNYYVYRNMLPDTADSTSEGGTLERWGLIKLGRLPFNATSGKYIIKGVGENGSTIPSGRVFVGQSNSQNYTIEASFTFSSGVDSFEVRSFEGGEDVRLAIGAKVIMSSPVSGVEREFEVIAETQQPQDAEPLEDYRIKVIEAFRYRARGGAALDYKFWASQVAGVKNTYPYTGVPLPQVNLFIESQSGNGVASPSLINDVKNYVEGPGRRPIGIQVNYLSVFLMNVEVFISGGASMTPSEQSLIISNIESYLDSKRPFVQSVRLPQNDTLNVNEMISIIQNTNPSVVLGNVTVNFNGVNYVTYKLQKGEIPNLIGVNFN